MKGVIAVVLLALVFTCSVAKPISDISCGDVDTSLASCVTYLIGHQTTPSQQCCDGVRKLRDMAKTAADRQTACECMKTAAARLQDLKDEYAKALPEQCGAPTAVPISRDVDCSKVGRAGDWMDDGGVIKLF